MEKHSCDCILGITCEAINCAYNESKKCTAEQIKVGGSDAVTTSQTDCLTFETR